MEVKRDWDGDDDGEAFEPTEGDLEGAAWAKAAESHNDPFYYSDLEEKARVLNDVSAAVSEIILHRDPSDRRHPNRVEVSLCRPRNTSEATRVACGLGEALDVQVRVVEREDPGSTPDAPQQHYRGSAPHRFFKNDVTYSRKR